jgi:hypothetical protein
VAVIGPLYRFTYGSLTVGAGTSYPIDGKVVIDQGYERGSIELSFLVIDADPPTHDATCQTVEAALRKFRQRILLQVDQDVSNNWVTRLDWNNAASTASPALAMTGFEQQPEVQKRGERHDTAICTRYTIRVSVELPAVAGFGGRRSSRVEVTYSESRVRTVTISGETTALPVTSTTSIGAFEQYQATISAFAATVLAAFASTSYAYELVSETAPVVNETDTLCTWSRTYREIIYNQAVSVLDNAAVVNPTLVLQRSLEAPGDWNSGGSAASVSRLVRTTIDYACSIDVTQIANHDVSDPKQLDQFYQATIRPWLLANLQAFKLGGAALVSEEFRPDPTTNRISATLSFVGLNGSNVLAVSLTVSDDQDFGRVFLGHWTGDPLAKSRHDGIGYFRRLVTVVFTQQLPNGTIESDLFGGPPNPPTNSTKDLAQVLTHQNLTASPKRLGQGIIGAPVLDVVDFTYSWAIELYKDVGSSTTPDKGTTGGGGNVTQNTGTGQTAQRVATGIGG